MHPDDYPLRAQTQRAQRGEICHFIVRHNPNYLRKKQQSNIHDDDDSRRLLIRIKKDILTKDIKYSHIDSINETNKNSNNDLNKNTENIRKNRDSQTKDFNYNIDKMDEFNESLNIVSDLDLRDSDRQTLILRKNSIKCQKRMSSCEKFNDNSVKIDAISYCPVYNIRQIKPLKDSYFSKIALDKTIRYPCNSSCTNMSNNNNSSSVLNKNSNKDEPAQKGISNFVYI